MSGYPGTPRYASWLARVGAGLIDLLFLIVVTAIAVVCMRLLHGVFAPDPDDVSFRGGTIGYADYLERTKNVTRILIPPTLLVVLAAHLWNVVIRQGRQGRSLGKQLVRIRLVDLRTGRTVGVGRSLVRQFAHAADALPCYLGYLWPLWDAQRQTLADKITGTVVVAGGLDHAPALPCADHHAPLATPFPGAAIPSASFPAAGSTTTENVTAQGVSAPLSFAKAAPPTKSPRKRRNLLLVAGALVGSGLLVATIVVVTARDDTTGSVPVPVSIVVPPVDALVMSPDGRRLYAAHRANNNISVIDTSNNTVAAVIPVLGSPLSLALTGDGAFLHIATEKAITVVATDTATVVSAAISEIADWDPQLAVTRDGRRSYVTNNTDGLTARPGPATVSVLDGRTGATVATIPLDTSAYPGIYGQGVYDIVLAPDDSTAYVVQSQTISIIDTATDTVRSMRPFSAAVYGRLGISPDGRYLYLRNDGAITIIDTTRDYYRHSEKVRLNADFAFDAAPAPNGRYLFVAGQVGKSDPEAKGVVEVVDLDRRITPGAVRTLETAFVPGAIAVSLDGRRVYAAGEEGIAILDVSVYA